MDSFKKCCICKDPDESGGNLIYECAVCSVAVHKLCYGVNRKKKNGWMCSVCKIGKSPTDVKCALCPNKLGAFKPTTNNKFVHVVCALFTPYVEFCDLVKMEPVDIDEIPRHLFKKECHICDSKKGAKVPCKFGRCGFRMHVTCGEAKNLLREEDTKGGFLRYIAYCEKHLPTTSVTRLSSEKISSFLRNSIKKKAASKNSSWILKNIENNGGGKESPSEILTTSFVNNANPYVSNKQQETKGNEFHDDSHLKHISCSPVFNSNVEKSNLKKKGTRVVDAAPQKRSKNIFSSENLKEFFTTQQSGLLDLFNTSITPIKKQTKSVNGKEDVEKNISTSDFLVVSSTPKIKSNAGKHNVLQNVEKKRFNTTQNQAPSNGLELEQFKPSEKIKCLDCKYKDEKIKTLKDLNFKLHVALQGTFFQQSQPMKKETEKEDNPKFSSHIHCMVKVITFAIFSLY